MLTILTPPVKSNAVKFNAIPYSIEHIITCASLTLSYTYPNTQHTTCVCVRREDSREGDDVLALDSLNAMPGGMSQVSANRWLIELG